MFTKSIVNKEFFKYSKENPDKNYENHFFHENSEINYLDFLNSRLEDKLALVGLWNSKTGQFLFKLNVYHKDLAKKNDLLLDKKHLKANWHGFCCAISKNDSTLGIIPKSTFFKGIPIKHQKTFEKLIIDLFSIRFQEFNFERSFYKIEETGKGKNKKTKQYSEAV